MFLISTFILVNGYDTSSLRSNHSQQAKHFSKHAICGNKMNVGWGKKNTWTQMIFQTNTSEPDLDVV
jgi:hypothetical protein